jgi:hypothetical protein
MQEKSVVLREEGKKKQNCPAGPVAPLQDEEPVEESQ